MLAEIEIVWATFLFCCVRYENTFVKSEFEHLQQEHTQTVETMKLQHETEVTNLRKEREAILSANFPKLLLLFL